MKNNIPNILLLAFVILNSCSRQTNINTDKPDVKPSNVVTLSSDQLSDAGIELGRITKMPLSTEINCSGTLEAGPNQQALVCAPLRGFLKKILLSIGDYVSKGTALAILEHSEYIILQQEFLEVSSQYEYFKEDFKRQGELTLEDAASVKTMQHAQNEFRKTEARLYSLRQQLGFLGINADSLTIDNMVPEIILRSPISGYITAIDNMVPEIILRSPISGYITAIDGQIGLLCDENEPIFAIVGTQSSILHLKVDEKNTPIISKGKLVEFSLTNRTDKIYKAGIKSVLRSADGNNSLNIIAEILNPSKELIPGMSANARIVVSSDSVYSVNKDAVVISEGKNYIFRKINDTQFESIEIKTGRVADNRIEITQIPSDLLTSEVVTIGASHLFLKLYKK